MATLKNVELSRCICPPMHNHYPLSRAFQHQHHSPGQLGGHKNGHHQNLELFRYQLKLFVLALFCVSFHLVSSSGSLIVLSNNGWRRINAASSILRMTHLVYDHFDPCFLERKGDDVPLLGWIQGHYHSRWCGDIYE